MKIVFLENDDVVAEANKGLIKRFAQSCGYAIDFKSLKVEDNLWRKKRDDVYKIIEDNDVIITWSVYTYNGVYDSRQQLKSFLRAVGDYNIEGKTYIDCTGYLVEALNRIAREGDDAIIAVLRAISTNTLITHHEWSNPKQVKLDFTKENIFQLVDYIK